MSLTHQILPQLGRAKLSPWLVSATFHGALIVALAQSAARRDVPPRIAGQRQAVMLEAVLSRPVQPSQEPVSDPLQLDVRIAPRRAEIAAQQFVQAETTLPEPLLPTAIESTLPAARAATEKPTPSDQPPATLAEPTPEANQKPQPAPAAAASAASRPRAQGTDETLPPRPIRNAPPIYPAQAMNARWQGEVVLRLEVDEAGGVARIEVVQSSGFEVLDAAAVRAVGKWQFEPARQTGKAVRWKGRLPVQFVLE